MSSTQYRDAKAAYDAVDAALHVAAACRAADDVELLARRLDEETAGENRATILVQCTSELGCGPAAEAFSGLHSAGAGYLGAGGYGRACIRRCSPRMSVSSRTM